MVFFAWMQAAFARLQKYKTQARAQWTRIDAMLQSRAGYVCRLLEIAEKYGFEDRALMAEIYDLSGGYVESSDREVVSEGAEKVSPLLTRFLALTGQLTAMAEDEEALGIKNDLFELEDEIIMQSETYNQAIDAYNTHRTKPSLKYQVAILGAMPLKGFYLKDQGTAHWHDEKGEEKNENK